MEESKIEEEVVVVESQGDEEDSKAFTLINSHLLIHNNKEINIRVYAMNILHHIVIMHSEVHLLCPNELKDILEATF